MAWKFSIVTSTASMGRLDKSAIWCLILLQMLLLARAQDAKPFVDGIDSSETPLLIVFTHDDNTDPSSAGYVTEITDKHKNPNGCDIKAAFYTTSILSDCETVKELYENGHEIGEHTMTHPDLYKDVSQYQGKQEEILGAREFIVSCGIPENDVVGHRSPYLSDDADVRKVLSEGGFMYDASIPEYYPSPISANATNRTFPYLLSNGIAQDCKYFGDINHCDSSEKYPNLWELPLYQYQKGPYIPSTNNLMDPEDAFNVLKADFDNRYDYNRAPMGIWTHSTTTQYLNKKVNRDNISKFFEYALGKPDVWVVTPRQLIEWLQSPVKASDMESWISRYGCNGGGKTPKSSEQISDTLGKETKVPESVESEAPSPVPSKEVESPVPTANPPEPEKEEEKMTTPSATVASNPVPTVPDTGDPKLPESGNSIPATSDAPRRFKFVG